MYRKASAARQGPRSYERRPMYDPHANPDLMGEMSVTGKGRLVKARLTDQAAPNVSWFWIPTGNCWACKYLDTAQVKCTNSKISTEDFFDKYMTANDCPEFETGVYGAERADLLDVMKAVGMVSGKPSQRIDVIVNKPWSVDLAVRAHHEQSTFLRMAHLADKMAQGRANNDPSRGEYVDLSDDLERASVATAPP